MNYKYILKNSLLILVTGFIISFSNFIFSPLYISKLGNDNFGILSLVLSISFLFTTLFSINNVAVIVRYSYISNEIKKIKFIGTAFILQLLFILFVVIIVLLSKGYFIDFFFDKLTFDSYLKYSLLIGALNSLQSIPLGYYWGNKLFLKYRLIPISNFCLNFLFLFYFLFIKNGDILDAINAVLLSSFLIAVFSVYKFFGISKFSFNRSFSKLIIRFSLPILLYSVVGLLIDIVIRQKIENILSLELLGLYSIIFLISSIPIIILVSVNNVWLPVIYNNVEKNTTKLFNDYIHLTIKVVLLLSLTVCLYANEILILFYDKVFINTNDASYVLIIMTLGNSLFGYLWIHFSNEMNYYKKTKGYFLTTLISLISIIFLSTFLINKFNFVGVALLSVISNFIICVTAYLILKLTIGVKGNYASSVLYYSIFILLFIIVFISLIDYNIHILFKLLLNLIILIYTFMTLYSYFKKKNLTFN